MTNHYEDLGVVIEKLDCNNRSHILNNLVVISATYY